METFPQAGQEHVEHGEGAEAKLRQRESELETILDNVPVIISSIDRQGHFRRVNRVYEALFGRKAGWVIGRHISEVAGEPHSTIAKPYVARALSGEPVSFDSMILDRDGKLRAVRVFYAPQRDASGELDGFIAMVEDVTERQQAEAALRESETRFRSLFNMAASGMVLCRVPDGRMLEVNQKLADLLGYRVEELLRMSFFEITHPEDIPFNLRLYEDLVSNRIPSFSYEKRYLHKDGRPIWVHSMVSAVFNEAASPLYTIAVVDDITERRRSERALRESENRFRTLAEALPQLVWTCLPNGDCDYLSGQWVEYTGIPEELQLGLSWLDLVMHPDDRERTYQSWMTAVAGQGVYDLEYRLKRYDGAYRWFKTRGTPLRNSDGQIVRWFGTCTDIHDQKKAEEERKESLLREQQGRASAELLNRVGPILLAELDPPTLIRRIADIATKLVRAEYGALLHNLAPAEKPVLSADITQDSRNFSEIPPHWLPAGQAPIRSYLAVPVVSRSGEPLGTLVFGHSQTGVFSTRDADLITGIAAQAAIALDNARLFSESQKAQGALRLSNQELQRANADLEQFAYAAAHDLQEPLRMISSYTQLLQRSLAGALESRTQEYLEFVVGGAKRMSLLLQDLLSYTETSRDEHVPPGPIDLTRVVAQSLHNLHSAIADSAAEIACDRLPSVVGREGHFVQLFQNLVGNAIKYAQPGEVPKIRLTVDDNGENWLFKVSDNGLGIEPAYHKQVFGVFKRLHGSEIPGTGIGLAICQRVVERAGGRIWVESALGQGATFCFTLPRMPVLTELAQPPQRGFG